MDKNAIKKYAAWARGELISRVRQKAYQYGIRENDIIDANADSIDGKILTNSEKRERRALIAQVTEKGFEQVMEEVAYTWFNRFSALRFMEVNGYLPTHVRVFTDEGNNFKPQIITEAIHMELDGLDMDKVYVLKEANDNDELFKYMLITQCNSLNEILPGMFQKISDYTELLFPDNLLREGSVIGQMITLIPENDWKDAVQIIGWLYQYYNIEPKAKIDTKVKKGIKVSKEELPAKTQIFTPDWIVRYMVENSLGRLWLEGHPNDKLKEKWNYYLDEAEQETDIQEQLDKIREEYKTIRPEQIKVMDCCMGSGHILVYAFDVLMQIYEAYGFNQRDAAKSIVENNIFGLDIDDRAAQLAYFAVMMKARQYDRRFFSRKVQPHVHSICESNHLDPFVLEYFINGDAKLNANMQILIKELHDAKEYGSILDVTNIEFDSVYARFDKIKNDISLYKELIFNELLSFVQAAHVMAQEYDVVVTNPPYMGNGDMNDKLSQFVRENYSIAKSDLFATFILKCSKFLLPNRFQAMITMQSWMNLGTFAELRQTLCRTEDIVALWHLDDTLLGIAYQTAAFILRTTKTEGYYGKYAFVNKKQFSINESNMYDLVSSNVSIASQDAFLELENTPIAYALGTKFIDSYICSQSMSEILVTREGMTTGNNELFLKLWYEVDFTKFGRKWFPYNKGGSYRKWYGNDEYLVNWENDGIDIKNNKDTETGRIRSHNYNGEYAFREGITWSAFSSKGATFRYSSSQFLFDSKGSKGFCNKEYLLYILSFLNSSVGQQYLSYFAGAKDKKPGHIISLPFREDPSKTEAIDILAKRCIDISKQDWDDYETSWEFKSHPLVLLNNESLLYDAYQKMAAIKGQFFDEIRESEEKINKLFAEIFDVEDEVECQVKCEDVTISVAKIKTAVESFISYAIGCMFGRYSLDVEGLVYAGGEWDVSKYRSYPADTDNIISICEDEYFEDDIVGRFVKFIETVYGLEFLEENLKFIADALGGTGTSREVIRKYFLNDFYNYHCSTYSVTGSGKRPIYWLFDSGKKNGFKALIYMHRYQPDTIARMRTDYVHEQQERYRTAIAHLEERINNVPTSERVKLNRQLSKLKDQDTEIRVYEEKMHHLADQMICIDLDDGVKKNYEIFKDVLAKIN